MNIINLKQNEKKIIKFNIKDATTKEVIPLTDCTFYLKMELENDEKVVEKQDTDFDKTEILKGIIKIILEPEDLDIPGRFDAQLKIIFPNGEIDKSDIFNISVAEAIV